VCSLITSCSSITEQLLLNKDAERGTNAWMKGGTTEVDAASTSTANLCYITCEQWNTLHLNFILRLLQSSHFGSRITALKEVDGLKQRN
jgi:hypothetical protein